jgi:hypothetical protein
MDLMKVPDFSTEHEPIVRCFYLNDNRVFFALVLSETNDSFLVGASSRLIRQDDGDIVCEPLIPVPVSRVMKTTLCMVTEPVQQYKYHYFQYLQEKGVKLLPDYLKEGVMEKVSDFIQTFSVGKPVAKATATSAPTVKEDFERRGIHGTSDYAFSPTITSEKIH